jgi:antitoxin (DNA-binding transcriptional repressor) of toxin-antitoxin stability system
MKLSGKGKVTAGGSQDLLAYLTRSGHNRNMVTEVKIAEFKAHLSEHLRAVRRGHHIIIKDRETPVAEVAPIQSARPRLKIRPAIGSLKDLNKLPGVRIKNLKPGDVDRALRETRMDAYDKWLAGKFTSKPR